MKTVHVMAVAGIAAIVAGVAGFRAGGGNASGRSVSMAPSTATSAASGGERKVLYWHDPMVPGPRFDKPGKSPFMDMQLVPVYADETSGSGVKVPVGVQQNFGLRTAIVRSADVSRAIDAIGTVQFDDRLAVAVQTRVAGYVERLAVRAPMEQVRQGQPLATIYAPDWLGPISELLALERAHVTPDLVAAARQRLRALSVPDALVQHSEETGAAQARFTMSAPETGIVAELGVREGAAVTPGMTLFRLAGLRKVWAVVDVPEAQAVGLRIGGKVKARLEADASQAFSGTLTELLPQVDAKSRTLQARFEVDNPAGRLVPGMLLRLRLAGTPSTGLLVSSEAVIRTGRRAVVIVQNDDGSFEPRQVELGAEVGDDIVVAAGLREGERVVASGQFLIDSEASLRSATDRLAPPAPGASAASSAKATTPAPVHRLADMQRTGAAR
jgi:Cu(I)/Ag(I) efflux system membrane fusion protein